MLSFLLNIDYLITFSLKNIIPHSLIFNSFFSFFSIQGVSFFIWLLIIFIVVFFEEKKHPGISKRDKKFIFIFLTTFLITFIITNFFLKNFFLRTRPNIVTSFNCPKDFSFPSSHAATAFAVAYVLTFFDKKRKWFYYFIAFLIAYSRIYLGCHYFFDVLTGAIIGLAISKVTVNISASRKLS